MDSFCLKTLLLLLLVAPPASASAPGLDEPENETGEVSDGVGSDSSKEEGGTLQFEGFYASVSYFLTGETRLYDKTQGTFTRVRPKKNFSLRNRTYGGLEIEARYSHLDLNDGDVHGGKMDNVTAGVTWYLFPLLKLKFNYGNADIENQEGGGRMHILQTRFEIDL